MEIIANVIRADEVLVTLVLLSLDGRVEFSSGYVHGYRLTEEPPEFAQEACVLHALRVMREWLNGVDQELLQYINIQAGDALTNKRTSEWWSRGLCKLQSPAASGIINDVQGMRDWLHTDVSLRPLFLPEDLSGGELGRAPVTLDLSTRLAEYFRRNVLPSAGEGWRAELPAVPHSLREIKDLLRGRHREDELSMIHRLAEHASSAANVIKYLGVTRPTVEEALKILRGASLPGEPVAHT